MSEPWVDISCTVKASSLNGRRMLKNIETGEVRYYDEAENTVPEGTIKVPDEPEASDETDEVPPKHVKAPVKRKAKNG